MNIRFPFLLTLFFLSACGFTPMHSAIKSNNADLFDNFSVKLNAVEGIGNKEVGFYLVQRIRDRVGASSGKDILILTPRITVSGYGTSSDDVASRYDTNLSVLYELRDKNTDKLLSRGSVKGSSTFGAPIDPYGLIAASNNAEQVIAKDVADRLLFKIAAYYAKDNK